jgi:hypothetical protein
MWYVTASVANSVEKMSDELLKTRIRKKFLKQYNRFPDAQETAIFLKKIKNFIKHRHNSIFHMRKEQLEKKVLHLIDEVMDEFKFD